MGLSLDEIGRLSRGLRKITDEIKNMHTQLDKLEFEFNNLPNNREGRRKEQKIKNKHEKIQKRLIS